MKTSSLRKGFFGNFILIFILGLLTIPSCEKKEGCDETTVPQHSMRLYFSIGVQDQAGQRVIDYPVKFGVSKTWCDGYKNPVSIFESGKTDNFGLYTCKYSDWSLEFNNSKEFWTIYFYAGAGDELHFSRTIGYDEAKVRDSYGATYDFIITK